MIGLLVKYELEDIWKEAAITQPKYCPGICLKEPRKSMKGHSQDSRCSTEIRIQNLLNMNLGLYR
jgi:hypothetical protein